MLTSLKMVSHHRRLHWAKRQQAGEDLIQNKLSVFHGEINKQLLLAIESPQDAEDFILFYLFLLRSLRRLIKKRSAHSDIENLRPTSPSLAQAKPLQSWVAARVIMHGFGRDEMSMNLASSLSAGSNQCAVDAVKADSRSCPRLAARRSLAKRQSDRVLIFC